MGANEKHDATYHGGEYTPNTADMRRWHAYRVSDGEQGKQEFDRWLETVRAEAKAEALNEYADNLGYRLSGALLKYGQAQGDFRYIIQELRARANHYKENLS